VAVARKAKDAGEVGEVVARTNIQSALRSCFCALFSYIERFCLTGFCFALLHNSFNGASLEEWECVLTGIALDGASEGLMFLDRSHTWCSGYGFPLTIKCCLLLL
jgi:hypothetical protein